MKIYVRLDPLRRPIVVDVEASWSVAELRKQVGADALYVAPRAGGAAGRCGMPRATLLEPLDDQALVTALVQPHTTLTAGMRMFPSSVGGAAPSSLSTSRDTGNPPDRARCREWQLTKNPTPRVTATQQCNAPSVVDISTRKSGPANGAIPGYAVTPACLRPTSAGASSKSKSDIIDCSERSESLAANVDLVLPTLGDDWDDLSVIDEFHDEELTASEATCAVANEVVQKVLIEKFRNGRLEVDNSSEASGVSFKRHAQLGKEIRRHCSIDDTIIWRGTADGSCSGSSTAELENLVFAWGDNSAGQCLVDDCCQTVPTPTMVPLQTQCKSLCCGSHSSLLITKQGAVLGGGRGTRQDDVTCPRDMPFLETNGLEINAIAAGRTHVAALASNGSLLSWASANDHGQAGVGAKFAQASAVMPQQLIWPMQPLQQILHVAVVSCGDVHSLALTDAGEVYAFGSNLEGQLGIGTVEQSPEPALVSGKLRGVPCRAIAAGSTHSLALSISGTVFAWGGNAKGQLGLGTSLSNREIVSRPTPAPRLPGAVRHISAGGCHSAIIVRKGRLLLAGDNSHGQLGHPSRDTASSYSFLELPAKHGLCARSVALGDQHTLLLTYDGELYAFGNNSKDQCGTGSGNANCESPVKVPMPTPRGRDCPLVVWAVAAGHDHNMVLCSLGPEAHERLPKSQSSAVSRSRWWLRRPTVEPIPGCRIDATSTWYKGARDTATASAGSDVCAATGGCSSKLTSVPTVTVPLRAKDGSESKEATRIQSKELQKLGKPPLVLLRPVAQPGAAPRSFTALSVAWLASHLDNPNSDKSELKESLCAALAQPSVLNACFCYPGLRTARLDAAGLCKVLAPLCTRVEGLALRMLDAAAEGIRFLSKGSVEELVSHDQVRALAVYLCLPVHHVLGPTPAGRQSRSMISSIGRIVVRMSATGRKAFRDLLANECGDVRVLRDFLVPPVRSLADDAIRNAGAQPWLVGPLWEVVVQLQLQRSLWEAVFLLQVLASASEQAASLLRPVSLVGSFDQDLMMSNVRSQQPTGLVDSSVFQLSSLAEGAVPPEVEFWLFQEHAQFHQITPTHIIEEPWWADAAGMLPRRFCSFMAHANLGPIAFKQRVLQVENVLRQRLSQEQVLWPQSTPISLRSSDLDPAAFYFMLSVHRQTLLQDTFAQMYSASPVDLRRPLRVEFLGEEAVDEGGVMREFFRLLSCELFSPEAGLYLQVEDSRRLWFNTDLGAGRQLEDYWMVGVIIALAVYNNHPGMDAPLPSALFKKLKDQPTTHDDLAQLFPSHARSLDAVLSWTPSKPVDSESAAEEADREFVDTFCLSFCWSETPLCEGGEERMVLYRDREDFAARAHNYLLHTSVQAQFESFACGFRRVCNSPLFDVLSASELEAIVAGDKDLNFRHLRSGAQYEGYSSTDPYIEMFWTVLEGFTTPRRRRFLSFCTGSDIAPTGGLQDLHMLVQKNGQEPTMRLPVAHTCFNLLLLPQYSSEEKLRAMLITAIEWTEGFGLQ